MLTFRPAKEIDIDNIIDLHRHITSTMYGQFIPSHLIEQRLDEIYHDWNYVFKSDRQHWGIWVAEQDGEFISFGSCKKIPRNKYPFGGECMMKHIYVKPNNRYNSVGRYMYKLAAIWFKEHNLNNILTFAYNQHNSRPWIERFKPEIIMNNYMDKWGDYTFEQTVYIWRTADDLLANCTCENDIL